MGMIHDNAVKCCFCNEFLKKEIQVPWYFSRIFITMALMFIGPFVLPLIWFHPTMSKIKKVAFSVFLLMVTFYFIQVFFSVQQMFNSF